MGTFWAPGIYHRHGPFGIFNIRYGKAGSCVKMVGPHDVELKLLLRFSGVFQDGP